MDSDWKMTGSPMTKPIQLIGAGLVALVVACVVVVMVFKEEREYLCNVTYSKKNTVEFFGLTLKEEIVDGGVSKWVKSVLPEPI